jgi:hypothetical protein
MYCITLRSRVDARITGWFDGSDSRWSTDYKLQKLFDEKRDARSVCQELRELCPRNAKFINVEAVYDTRPCASWPRASLADEVGLMIATPADRDVVPAHPRMVE